jgi:amino acid transporter
VAELAGPVGWVSKVLDVGIAASFFACVTGSTNALARVLFSMGREGVLPSGLGRTHHRFGTPHLSLALVLPVLVAVPVACLLAGASGRTVLAGTVTVSAFGYVLAYVLVCAAAPVFLRRIGELTPAPLVGGLVAALLWLVVLGVALVGASWGGGRALPLVFGLAMLPGLAWLLWLCVRRPDRLARVGVYDETTVDSVLPGSLAA